MKIIIEIMMQDGMRYVGRKKIFPSTTMTTKTRLHVYVLFIYS